MGRPAKYTCNEQYFENITTQNQAYILGFIWADGYLDARSGLSITVKEADVEILQFIKNELNSNAPINIHTVNNNNNYVRFSVNRQKIYKSLVRLGLGKPKSQNNAPIPVLPKELFPHFVRGFFDGDGSIWYNTAYRANFSGGYDFLVWLKHELENLGIQCNNNIKSRRKGNLNGCSLDITNRKNITKLAELLYNNAEFKLKRKFIRFEEALKKYQKADEKNWKLNGVGAKIKKLLDEGFLPHKISIELKLGYRTTRRIADIIRKEGYEFSIN